jgi:hypothetical protein
METITGKDGVEWLSITTDPISIALVAPSGAGKTTLISTVMKDINGALPAKFIAEAVSSKDAAGIQKFNIALEAIIKSSEVGFSINPNEAIGGSAYITEYHYRIKYEDESAKLLVSQPFTLMDQPGGLLDIDNHYKQEDEWNRYKKHLRNSIALWIPIDAPLLFEARRPDERGERARLLRIGDVKDIAHDWARYRAQHTDEPAYLCLAPVKCETYFSKADTPLKTTDFFKIFMEEYGTLIDDVKKTLPRCHIYYTPVESIGCIKLKNKEGINWNIGKGHPEVSYILTGRCTRQIAGAESLVAGIYLYAGKRIIKTIGSEYEKMCDTRKKNPFLWLNKNLKDQIDAIEKIYTALRPMSEMLTPLSKRANAYKYFRKL